jgi:Zn finger protein HypA/HybF involved in hydrogenase expression
MKTDSLKSRLQRMQAKREGEACEECGYGSFAGPTTYSIEFVEEHEDDEYCPKCGRQTSVEIVWPEDL